jgi:hypothetical protein
MRRSVVAGIIALGITFRLLQYLGNRSLWLDEVLMLPGIVDRSFAEILHPKNWAAIPPGFALLTKLAVVAFGNNEMALRLVPLSAGIASLFLFLATARRCLTPRAVPIALALFAVSPFLIYYASELKPYSSDATVALLTFVLAFRLLEDSVSRRRAMMWGIAGLAAAFFSLTGPFVIAGVTLALVVSFWYRRELRSGRRLLIVLLAWSALFAIPYLLFLRGLGENEYLREFWASGYMPFPPRSLADLGWYPGTLVRLFRDPLGVISDRQTEAGFYQAAAGMLAFATGALWMWGRQRTRLLLLTLPILFTLVASALSMYPFGGKWTTGGRIILFLAPSFFLVMGEGVEQLRRRMGAGMRGLAYAVMVLLLVPSVVWALVMVPSGRDEIKPVLAYVQQQWQNGDVLYVHYDMQHPFRYYARGYGFEEGDYLTGVCARAEPRRYLDALAPLRGQGRVWVLFGSGRGANRFDEKGLMMDYLEHMGRRLDDQIAMGASVYLYDLRDAAANPESYRVRIPPIPASIDASCALWN